MRRRDFIVGVGASIVPVPAARAAQARIVALLMPFAPGDTTGADRIRIFLTAMQALGWVDGRNMRIDLRWATGSEDEIRKQATELVRLKPDVIIANGSATVGPLLKITRSVPIVFAIVPDPVGAGFVDSLANPGGNATGFLMFETSISGKWLELLKEIAPGVRRAAVLHDPLLKANAGQFDLIQSALPSLGVELTPVDIRDAGGLERGIADFAKAPNGGLIITASSASVIHRDLIVGLAARHGLPAVYPARYFPDAGGLLSYGPDLLDQYRHAASYADRILKGEKPATLPVQAPNKYELIVNLKTAKALGLTPPGTLLARADEVIE
jgi:putative ABC transport system substrate-binding protein